MLLLLLLAHEVCATLLDQDAGQLLGLGSGQRVDVPFHLTGVGLLAVQLLVVLVVLIVPVAVVGSLAPQTRFVSGVLIITEIL